MHGIRLDQTKYSLQTGIRFPQSYRVDMTKLEPLTLILD